MAFHYWNTCKGLKFVGSNLQIKSVIKKDRIITNIAGATGYNIYFKTLKPNLLYTTDFEFQKGTFLTLNVPIDERIASAFYTIVDSPRVDVLAYNGPAVITSNLNDKRTVVYKFPTALYTKAVKISDATYIFRGFDTVIKGMRQVFIRGNPSTGEIRRLDDIDGSINKDVTGIISDGRLNYDKQTNLLTYLSFYTNTFICLDTNLNIVYKSKTIDTVANSQITAEINLSSSQYTNTTPRRIINSRNSVYNGKLYNISTLISDNEISESFRNNLVTDVYDIRTGVYGGSFYIPAYKRERVRDFKILHNTVIALYDSYIVIYKINFDI